MQYVALGIEPLYFYRTYWNGTVAHIVENKQTIKHWKLSSKVLSDVLTYFLFRQVLIEMKWNENETVKILNKTNYITKHNVIYLLLIPMDLKLLWGQVTADQLFLQNWASLLCGYMLTDADFTNTFTSEHESILTWHDLMQQKLRNVH